MLSVFITPCEKPTACHCAISLAVRWVTSFRNSWYLSGASARCGKVPGDDVIGELRDLLMLVAVEEHLERAEAHMRGRQARHHGGGFDALAIHLLVAADDAQRAPGGDAQAVHGFRTQVFADAGAQHGAAVAAARIGRDAGALELHIPELSGAVAYLAQQDRAPVAQLRHEVAELVSGVEHGQRIAARQQAVADEVLGEIGARCFCAVEIDQARGVGIEADQIGSGQRGGMQAAVKTVRQAGKVFSKFS